MGQVLAGGLLARGHEVTVSTRDPAKLEGWRAEHPAAEVAGFAEAAAFGEVLVLAVKGSAARTVLDLAGRTNVADEVVIDATNPTADAPPEGGVLKFFTALDDSLMERLQREFVEARFVKAFNSVGNAQMVGPRYPEGRPAMFICGDDPAAKEQVTALLDAFGWDAADMGGAVAARAIEPLCILWCLPGFLRNKWTHALKLLK